jgi:hypothetical protein
MMKHDSDGVLEEVLAQIAETRRDFIKRLLAGAASAAALPIISTESAAQPVPVGKGIVGQAVGQAIVKGTAGAGKGGGGYAGKGGGSGYRGKGGGGYAGKGGGSAYQGKGGGGRSGRSGKGAR